MAVLRTKETSGKIVFPDTIPVVDVSNLLYGAASTGWKEYTATEDCVAFMAGAGQSSTPTTIIRDDVSNQIAGQLARQTIQLKKGDTIKFPGYSNWPMYLYVYGLKYSQ